MDLKRLIYAPLMEEHTDEGWEKDTIIFSNNNRKIIEDSIRRSLGKREFNSMNSSDIEDIYSEILLYLYKVDDYNVNKAERTTEDGKKYIIPLEGYVFKSIEFCIKRFVTNKYNRECLLADTEIRGYEDNTLDLLDTIADDKTDTDFENTLVDLNQHCKEYESMRYNYGIDILQVLYIRLLIMNKKLDSSCFDTMMDLLGISKRDLKAISVKAYNDETILEFARGVNKHGIQKSIDILEQYVYSAEQIKKAIESLKLQEVV